MQSLFHQLPPDALRYLTKLPRRPPLVVLDAQAAAQPEAQALQKRIEFELQQETAEILPGTSISFATFLTNLEALVTTLGRLVRDGRIVPANKVVQTTLWRSANLCTQIWGFIYFHVSLVLSAYSALDAKLFTGSVASLDSRGGYQPSITVHCAIPEKIQVVLDGQPRPVYRCGGAFDQLKLMWVSWPRSVLGLADGASPLPVYVQRHVLHQLRERLNIRNGPHIAEYFMLQSLRDPVVRERVKVGWFIDYRLGADRLGYLLVALAEDKVIVRTFLFLTMDDTPEGRRLRQELRLDRRGREWLGLDTLAPFLERAVAHDQELVDLFTACGCGHLLTLQSVSTPEAGRERYRPDLRKLLASQLGRPRSRQDSAADPHRPGRADPKADLPTP